MHLYPLRYWLPMYKYKCIKNMLKCHIFIIKWVKVYQIYVRKAWITGCHTCIHSFIHSFIHSTGIHWTSTGCQLHGGSGVSLMHPCSQGVYSLGLYTRITLKITVVYQTRDSDLIGSGSGIFKELCRLFKYATGSGTTGLEGETDKK